MPVLNLLPPIRGGNRPSGNKPTFDSRPTRSAFGGSHRKGSHSNSDARMVPCETACGGIANAVKTAAGPGVWWNHLHVAIHLVFGQANDGGLRALSSFLKLSGLDEFLPASYGALQAFAAGREYVAA